jgi:hypothetical protein
VHHFFILNILISIKKQSKFPETHLLVYKFAINLHILRNRKYVD